MSLNAASLSNHAKTAFLARLSHALTISARETYEVGTDRVLEPEILRAYNELLHRVAGAVANHLEGIEGYSVEFIVEMVQHFGQKHKKVGGTNWAIEWALKKPLE